jgi:hypothetical protein
MDEEGHIPEEHFDRPGFRTDKDIYGNDVVRSANISQESYQRSKCLTHSHQVNLRLEHLQIIKSKEIEKKTTANMKHEELVTANKLVVGLICEKLKQDGIIGEDAIICKDHVKLCPMKIFSELTNPHLEAFILAHDATITSKSQLPSKGTLKDAEENTVRNQIRVAFDCRECPNKIKGVLPFDLSMDIDEEDNAQNYWVHLITLTKDDTVQPSSLLGNIAWVKFVTDLLDLERTSATSSKVSDSQKEKADLLLIKLREQFKVHVKERVKQASKQNHWILKFAFKNLPVVAATMVLLNRLKLDLKCLSKLSCLLACHSNHFIPCDAFPRREGAYLYYDINQGVFVRSGKVVRHGFGARHSEHLAASKEEKSLSHFYFMYPSSEGKRQEKRDKLGSFESLTQVIAAGFDPTSEHAKLVDKDYNAGGLLIMCKDDEHR